MLQTASQPDSGLNFAPMKPLQKLGKTDKPQSDSGFCQFLKDLHTQINGDNIPERREIAEVARLMANCRSGKLILDRDPLHGNYILLQRLPQRPKNNQHVYPLAQVNSSQLTAQWTLSRSRSEVRQFGNTTHAQIQSHLLETVAGYYRKEWMNEWFHQAWSLDAMDWGTYAIRPYYDDKLNKMTNLIPVIENQAKAVFEGYAQCRDCGMEGLPEQFQPTADGQTRCPQCGGTQASIVPAEHIEIPQVVGQQEVSQGDIGIELVKMGGLNWDMRGLVQDSPFVHNRTEVSKRFVEQVIGVEVMEQDPSQDWQMRLMQAVSRRGGNLKGYGRENLWGHAGPMESQVTLMDEEWFKPEFYAGQTFSTEEETVSGQVIPANTPLEQIFPDGLCAVGFNDMDVVVGAYNEKCRIKSCVYHIQSQSGVGNGTQAAVEISEQINMAHSANLEVIKRHGAGGGTAYDRNVITPTEAKKLYKPGELVGVNLRNTPYTDVNQVIRQITTGELNQSNMVLMGQLVNLLNIGFQTTDFTSGVAENQVNIDTLGGQQMLAAQNQQRSAAPLRLKAWLTARIDEEVVDLFRTYIKQPKYFATSDKYAMAKGRLIAGTDLPEKVKFDHVEDSETPTNKFEKQNASERMLEKSGLTLDVFTQLSRMEPRTVAWWADRFGAELPLYNYNELLIICQDRVDDIKQRSQMEEQIAQMSGLMLPPQLLAQKIVGELTQPVFVTETNQTIKADILRDFMDDEEVQKWSPLMRESVNALISLHMQNDSQYRWGLQGLEAQGQMGVAMAGAQAMQPMVDAENEKARGQQQEDGAFQLAGDELQKDRDFERSEEGAENAHKRSKDLERTKAKLQPAKPGGASAKRKN